MIIRKLTENIQNNLPLKKAVVILGARQVGKTTLLQQLNLEQEDTLVLNGDEPDVRELLTGINSSRLKNILGGKQNVIIDEAQLIPEIGITLKLISDQLKDVQLFVSGSSSIDLASKINEPLTGRKLEYQMYPVSFAEMVKHHGLLEERRQLPHRLTFGSYPEIITSPGNEVLLLKNIAGSYLFKDILSFGEIKKPVVLEKLLKALALQVGNEVSFNELSQIVGADKETVEKYIDLLEKAFIVFRLNALNRNVRNEIKKGKKIYFIDNGIRNAVIGNFMLWENRLDKGALWENYLVSERVKYLYYNGFYGSYYFWRTTQQQEIDYIEEQDGKFKVFEFKLSPKKQTKLSVTFKNAYLTDEYQTISMQNVEDFLMPLI
jgi:predicted AAA+ superfamily ATPase